MYTYTKILYVKRTAYIEVFVCYSRKGEKFRPTTGVKVLPKHVTKNGDISVAHPHYEQDLQKIGAVQQRVESLIAEYIEHHHEKPPRAWLEKAFHQREASEQIAARPPLQEQNSLQKNVASVDVSCTPRQTDNRPLLNAEQVESLAIAAPNIRVLSSGSRGVNQEVLCYWKAFMTEKGETVRNVDSLKRLNNARYSLNQYNLRRNVSIRFSDLSQRFFNDYIVFMVSEQEYYRNRHQRAKGNIKPTVGLNNDTTIKRLSDLMVYLRYCKVVENIDLDIEKIEHFIEVARKKNSVYPFKGKKRWELKLTIEEIEFVVNLDCHAPLYWSSLSDNQKRYLDIFIFMCLQGTNPKDTQSITRTDIEEEGIDKNIIRDRSKTFVEFDVPLDPIAEAILERNNYNLTFTEQTLNRELKNMFVTIFELYRPIYEARTRFQYKVLCKQRSKKGDKEVIRLEHRGRYVEASTGRRSYISNHTKLVGIQDTMGRVGHTSESTTIGYAFGEQQAVVRKSVFGINKKTPDDQSRLMA